MSQGFTKGVPVDTDVNLAADSNLLIPSQHAVKTYIDNEVAGISLGSGTVTLIGLSAGTGISVGGTNPVTTSGTITVTNTAPDQTVTLTAGSGINITGSYPNFTVTNTAAASSVNKGFVIAMATAL